MACAVYRHYRGDGGHDSPGSTCLPCLIVHSCQAHFPGSCAPGIHRFFTCAPRPAAICAHASATTQWREREGKSNAARECALRVGACFPISPSFIYVLPLSSARSCRAIALVQYVHCLYFRSTQKSAILSRQLHVILPLLHYVALLYKKPPCSAFAKLVPITKFAVPAACQSIGDLWTERQVLLYSIDCSNMISWKPIGGVCQKSRKLQSRIAPSSTAGVQEGSGKGVVCRGGGGGGWVGAPKTGQPCATRYLAGAQRAKAKHLVSIRSSRRAHLLLQRTN